MYIAVEKNCWRRLLLKNSPCPPAPQGKIVYSNRDFFEGNFKEGQIEGEGTLRCRNGLEYIGHWKHSQVHVVYIYIHNVQHDVVGTCSSYTYNMM